MGAKITFVHAQNVDEIATARQLFGEYAESLGFSLCFQNFNQELADLPGKYSPPSGRLLLAYVDDQLAGCIALRKHDSDTCEMKRLFLRPDFRGMGLGKALVVKIIDEAKTIGYQRMCLDTIPGKMDSAIALYEAMGFQDVSPYYDNPVAGARFMQKDLRK
jgi:putative acetyltransferase